MERQAEDGYPQLRRRASTPFTHSSQSSSLWSCERGDSDVQYPGSGTLFGSLSKPVQGSCPRVAQTSSVNQRKREAHHSSWEAEGFICVAST